MSGIEGFCKHGKIWRNCYACHLEFTYPDEKTPMDTIHETISELKIRVSKLEQYTRLQSDHNLHQQEINAVLNDEIKKLSDFQSVINQRWACCVEHKNKQIDENRAVSKQLDRFDEEVKNLDESINELTQRNNGFEFRLAVIPKNLENTVEVNFNTLSERLKKLEDLAKIRFFVAQESPQWESTEKTKNMTFIQAFKSFSNGKTIMRNAIRYTCAERDSPTFSPNDVLATDWEIAP